MSLFNRTSLVLASIISIHFSVQSLAASKREGDVQVIKMSPQYVIENSSEHQRLHKTFSISGQVAGYGPSPTFSKGIIAEYFINHNQLIHAEATSGELNYMGLDNKKLRSQSFGAHFKQFWGNTFYTRMGLDHLRIDSDNYTYSRSSLIDNNGIGIVVSQSQLQFTGSMTGATLTIGNQWQWENFTLGCDWIGFTKPLATSISSESSTPNDREAKERLESDKKFYLTESKIQVLRFYLGASF